MTDASEAQFDRIHGRDQGGDRADASLEALDLLRVDTDPLGERLLQPTL